MRARFKRIAKKTRNSISYQGKQLSLYGKALYDWRVKEEKQRHDEFLYNKNGEEGLLLNNWGINRNTEFYNDGSFGGEYSIYGFDGASYPQEFHTDPSLDYAAGRINPPLGRNLGYQGIPSRGGAASNYFRSWTGR